MKACPQCGRECDNTMSFCLDDGTELLYGPGLANDPATAILHETAPPGEAATRAHIHTTATEAEPPSSLGCVSEKRSFSANRAAKPLIALATAVVLLVGGFLSYRYFGSSPGSGPIDSIAVLPLQNMGNHPNFEYLSDGIAESLINSLTQLPQLKVIARNTAFRSKGTDVDPRQRGHDRSTLSMRLPVLSFGARNTSGRRRMRSRSSKRSPARSRTSFGCDYRESNRRS